MTEKTERSIPTDDEQPDEDRPQDSDVASVLIVDDEADLTVLYANWLESEFAVETALNGEEALDKLTDDIDVVLLDRRMPDISGDEVLAEIRGRELDCRVAMVTAIEPDLDIIEMGFDDYVTKPIVQDELTAIVRRLLDLQEFDTILQEHFALASKLGALEASLPAEELEADEEYAELVDRFAEIDQAAFDRLGSLMDGVGDRVFQLFLRDPDASAAAAAPSDADGA